MRISLLNQLDNKLRDISNINWFTFRNRNSTPNKLCLRYRFNIPQDNVFKDLLENTNKFNENCTQCSNYKYNHNSITKDYYIHNNKYDVISNYTKLDSNNIYLPQILNTIIPIKEMSCLIHMSKN